MQIWNIQKVIEKKYEIDDLRSNETSVAIEYNFIYSVGVFFSESLKGLISNPWEMGTK